MERPRPQELYRHFKGNLYQVLTIAIHSETREEMVVYQALYGDYKVYCRPLDMFMSEVDRAKYPDVKQKMRFEKVTPEISSARREENEPVSSQVFRKEPERETEPENEPETVNRSYDEIMSKTVDEEAKELNLDPLVIEFMDADLAVDKMDILARLKPKITDNMIDIMAMSFGVVVKEGDVYDRYNDLMTCLSAREKFESTRLRS
ncbi:MAG: DUF1653 domain-containing protein [Butyrivibrio sp.]|nr:DUF1653 domain-containing protein [Butyrivibrio sp.]